MRVWILTGLLGCTGGGGGEEASTTSEKPVAADAVELRIAYGSEKKAWFEEQIQAFEATGPKTDQGHPIDVQAVGSGSGEAMQDILSGKSSPHVYSPASSAYLALLNDQWLQQPGHTTPLTTSSDLLVLSPVVIAMWKPMAEALGWPAKAIGWGDLLEVSSDRKGWASFGHPEWGAFKLAHTHPGLSNSGLLAVLAEVYAGAGKTRGLSAEDLASPAVAKFLDGVEGSLVHYGKSTTFLSDKMRERGPEYVSAAVLYESMVLEAASARTDLPLVAIYPVEGTFWSDHPYAVLDAPQTGPEERDAAAKLLAFLKAKPAQEAALKHGFRPADPSIALGPPLTTTAGLDMAQPQTLLDVPDGKVLSGVLSLWEQHKKPADVTLVFDKSGSMRGDPLYNAKAGARAFLDSLGDRDSVSLLFFDDAVGAPPAPVPLAGSGRPGLEDVVNSAIASGGTALYDAVIAAYDAEASRAAADPATIHAVVVMTDGRDENSKQNLDAVKARLSSSAEGAVKVFTIAYGEGADPAVLGAIADAGRGSMAQGGVGDISAVFRDMAAFF